MSSIKILIVSTNSLHPSIYKREFINHFRDFLCFYEFVPENAGWLIGLVGLRIYSAEISKIRTKKAVTYLVTASLSVTPTGFKPVTA